MFGWLRKKKKSKSLSIKISATQISAAKRRDMDTAVEWFNELLDNDGFEVVGGLEDGAAIEKCVEIKGRYSIRYEIDFHLELDFRQHDDH